jgi:hypothetical protein
VALQPLRHWRKACRADLHAIVQDPNIPPPKCSYLPPPPAPFSAQTPTQHTPVLVMCIHQFYPATHRKQTPLTLARSLPPALPPACRPRGAAAAAAMTQHCTISLAWQRTRPKHTATYMPPPLPLFFTAATNTACTYPRHALLPNHISHGHTRHLGTYPPSSTATSLPPAWRCSRCVMAAKPAGLTRQQPRKSPSAASKPAEISTSWCSKGSGEATETAHE